MKNAAFILVVCALVLSLSTPAWANRDDYATGFIGASIASDSELAIANYTGPDIDLSYDIGFVVGIAVGHDFGNTRFDFEIGYLRNDMDELSADIAGVAGFGSNITEDVNGDISIMTLLLNLYYDFKSSGQITPYITGGLGLGSAEVDVEGTNETDAVTVLQIGAGIAYEISETTSIDFRYRYLVTSDIEYEVADVDIEFSSHNILLGITKRF